MASPVRAPTNQHVNYGNGVRLAWGLLLVSPLRTSCSPWGRGRAGTATLRVSCFFCNYPLQWWDAALEVRYFYIASSFVPLAYFAWTPVIPVGSWWPAQEYVRITSPQVSNHPRPMVIRSCPESLYGKRTPLTYANAPTS